MYNSGLLPFLLVAASIAWCSAFTAPTTLSLNRVRANFEKQNLVSHPFASKFELHAELDGIGAEHDGSCNSPMLQPVIVPVVSLAALPVMMALFGASPAEAAEGAEPISSAFAAYGHYASILVWTMAITCERFTVKANMSDEEEDRLAIADIITGIAGAGLAYSGYLRATQFGKGWEFYQHEPIFWLKLTLVGVAGACSFFPTVKIIQRSVDKAQGKLVPMSPALAERMIKCMNAELLAIVSIPLTASLMSRGVFYSEYFPWPLGAGVFAVSFLGLGAKYVKEALDWKEPGLPAETK